MIITYKAQQFDLERYSHVSAVQGQKNANASPRYAAGSELDG